MEGEDTQSIEPEEMNKIVKDVMLKIVPDDGSSIGNRKLLQELQEYLMQNMNNLSLIQDDFWKARNQLIEEGLLIKGRGKGGSVYRPVMVKKSNLPQREADLYKPVYSYLENT